MSRRFWPLLPASVLSSWTCERRRNLRVGTSPEPSTSRWMIFAPTWANSLVTGRSPPTVRLGSEVIWRPAFCSRLGSRPSTSAAGIKPTNWRIPQTEAL